MSEGRWGSCGVHRSWGVKAFTSLHQFRHAKCPCTQLWAFSARLVPILGVQRPFATISGVERQNHACSGRSAPALLQGAILAFSAQMLPILGVQRQILPILGVQCQNHALFWRLNARQMLLQGVIFLLLFLIPFSIFIFIL